MPDPIYVGRKVSSSHFLINKYVIIVGVLVSIYGFYEKYYINGMNDRIYIGIGLIGLGFFSGCLAAILLFGGLSFIIGSAKKYSEITKQSEWAWSNIPMNHWIFGIVLMIIALIVVRTAKSHDSNVVEDIYHDTP